MADPLRVLDRFARGIIRRATPPLTPVRGMASVTPRVDPMTAMSATPVCRRVGNDTVTMFVVDIDAVDDPAAEVD